MRRIILPIALAIALVAAGCGCTQRSTLAAVPYLPPSYYACIETTPEELLKAYTANYGDYTKAQAVYTGQVFVFKKLRVDQTMLYDENTFIYSTLTFHALEPGSVARLKAGETIDVVGVNQGMPLNYPGCLTFSDSIFLPAGTVELPAPGGAGFTPIY